MLVCGLILFKDYWLLGLGIMLAAGEIPRIAGMFGLVSQLVYRLYNRNRPREFFCHEIRYN